MYLNLIQHFLQLYVSTLFIKSDSEVRQELFTSNSEISYTNLTDSNQEL